MREIKFRGKADIDGQWKYGDLHQRKGDCYIIENDVTNIYLVDPETVDQFTGMYDADGKEIYEGDILEYKNEINEKAYRRSVVFNQAAFCLEIYMGTPRYEYYNPIRNYYLTTWEIVGNIHDNPELMEGGDQ